MANADLLGWWDYILRLVHCCDESFGGKCIVFCGDHGQLPPVMALPLYSRPELGKNTAWSKSFSGYAEYMGIKEVYMLDKVERVDEGEVNLLKLVNAIRDGNIGADEDDPIFQILQSRFPMNIPESERKTFQDDHLVHLWYCKKPVREYNLEKIKSKSTPVARINAVHPNEDKESAAASVDDAGGLECQALLCVGARVMLTNNCWQDAYLNNGSLGTVIDIVYSPGTSPPELPKCVIVQFDKYLGPSFLPDKPRCVAVCPKTRKWESQSTIGTANVKTLSRTQLPLMLAYALTIYKSQGQEFDHLFVHPGEQEYQAGALFVALSRATKSYLDSALRNAISTDY